MHADTGMVWPVGIGIVLLSLLPTGCASTHGAATRIAADSPDMQVVKREDWGWRASDSVPVSHTITRITVHHSGEDFRDSVDPIQYLRRFQEWCRVEKHWIDIPYHFLLDLQGTIYEGRPLDFPGDTNTDYDVRGHALICVLGNYEHQVVRPQQIESLVRLIAFLMRRFSVTVDGVKTHRDYTETLCPGADLYRYFNEGTVFEMLNRQPRLRYE